MLHAGKKALSEFDAQLAALRQQCHNAPFPQPPAVVPKQDASVTAPPSAGTLKRASSITATPAATSASSIIYSGSFDVSRAAPSKAAQHLDPNEFQDVLSYLKKAKRDRLAEFESMQEAFEYHEEDEEARVERNRQWAKHPLVTYEQPLNDPFVFVPAAIDDESTDWRPSPSPAMQTASTPASSAVATGTTSASKQGYGRRLQESPSAPRAPSVGSRSSNTGAEFQSLYDVSTAITKHTAPAGVSTASASNSRSASTHGRGTAPALRIGSSSSTQQAQPASAFASLIPSRPIVDAAVARRAGDATLGLATAGSVVPFSSVSVKAHIQAGLQSQQLKFRSSRAGSASYTQLYHRPTCTVSVLHEGGVKFCSSCGCCCVMSEVLEERKRQLCVRCGERLIPEVVTAAPNTLSITSDGDDGSDALREIEEMERREAEAFRKAIDEWRSGDSKGDPVDTKREVAAAATASSVASARPSLPSLPTGPTYFSFLWEQMQLHSAAS